jgi:predicted MFS family arabinose efflux permease
MLAGQHLGWRGTFWSVAVLAAVAAVIIGRFVPATSSAAVPSVRSELRAFRDSRLWLVLAATVLVMGGCMGTFSFLTPLLTDRAGIAESLVPVVFVCFGLGSMIGTNLAGRYADQSPVATFLTAATGAVVILALLVPVSTDAAGAVVLITLLGVVTMSIPPVATGLSARLAATAPTLAVAFTISAFNGGIAIGSLVGGSTLNTSLGAAGPAAVGVLMVVLGLIPLTALAIKRVGGSEPAEPAPTPSPSATARELVNA